MGPMAIKDCPMQGEDDPGASRWHLDRRVNIGHLLTTLTLAAGLFMWGSKMDTRVTVLEVQGTTQERSVERQDAIIERNVQLMREEFRALRDEMREQNRKLDKLVERNGVEPRNARRLPD